LNELIAAMEIAKPFVCLFMYGRIQHMNPRKTTSKTNTVIT
jgi:hypothetical protein